MTRVIFYVLEGDQGDDGLRFACRLADKAWRSGSRSFVALGNAAARQRLGDLMWTFRDQSFLAHETLQDGTDPSELKDLGTAPVVIGHPEAAAATPGRDILINLDGTVTDKPAAATIMEVVSGGEPARQRARQRFRHYRDMGLTPETHTIESRSQDPD